MIVDIYTHIFPDRFFQELERGSPKLGNMGKRLRSVRKLFDLDAALPRHGRDRRDYRQIISLPNPPIEDIAEGEVAKNLARVANDFDGRACAPSTRTVSRRSPRRCRCTTSISPSPRPTAPSRWARAACRPSPTSPAIRSTSRASGRSSRRWPRTTCRSGCIRRAPRHAGLRVRAALALRDVVVLRLALRDHDRDVPAGVRRHLRPASEAEDHHPPSRRRHDPVLRRPHRAGHGRARRSAPSTRTTPRCCPR